MAKILIFDGNRHMRASGYGQLARSIILSLKRHTNHDLVVQVRGNSWDDVPHKEELLTIPEAKSKNYDLVLKIGPPQDLKSIDSPTIVYTQNALGDLRTEWVEWLKPARAIIVPGEFDSEVFKKYFNNVFICHQYVDETIFKPNKKYRSEGANNLSFLFVGSFGHRKGVDLIFKNFSKAFSHINDPISLTLHCFSGLEKLGVNQLLQYSKLLPSNISLKVYNGSLSPSWMNRIYNQHDVIFTFSRGEGWCMPLHEALLCEKVVIAPNSTAMGECLPNFGVRKIQVNNFQVDDISDSFGKSMINHYGGQGIFFYEPDEVDSINAIRDVHHNFAQFNSSSKLARKFILDNYSLIGMAEKINSVIHFIKN